MKRYIALLLSLLLFAGACGCGGKEKIKETGETITEETGSAAETVPETASEPEEETFAVSAESASELTENTETETEETTTEPETPSPKIGLTALAVVPNYVNVRTAPSTDAEIIGKIYNYCAAEILDEVPGEGGNWYLMRSGNVEGYIIASCFVIGDDAESMRSEVGVLTGTVTEDYLRVRSEPDLSNLDNVFTYFERGTQVVIEELTEDGWAKVEADDAATGYVYAECMDIELLFKTAVTLEEEAAEIARQQELEEKARLAEEALRAAEQAAEQRAAEQAAAASSSSEGGAAVGSNVTVETNSELRAAIVAFALQYQGKPYVHGGRSLDTGTDCSGFTSLVYGHFGYGLSYTPAGQAEQGTRISLADAQPGDLIFYSNSQKYLGHVALYIGNGQIIHARSETFGILVDSVTFRDPLFAVRILP